MRVQTQVGLKVGVILPCAWDELASAARWGDLHSMERTGSLHVLWLESPAIHAYMLRCCRGGGCAGYISARLLSYSTASAHALTQHPVICAGK